MKFLRRILQLWAALLLAALGGATSYAQNDAARTDMSVTNGTVQAVLRVGNVIYIGGAFTEVRSPITGETVERLNIAALDAATGKPTDWNPGTDGQVRAIAVDNNRVVIGGSFTQVAGQTRNRLAAINASTGNLTSWNPDIQGGINAEIYTLLVAGDTLMVGGDFNSVGGVTKNNLAAFSLNSFDLLNAYNLDTDGPVFTLARFNARMYLGGRFGSFKGASRQNLAAMNLTSGQIVSGWVPNPQGEVHALACAAGKVFVGGEFTQISGTNIALVALLRTDNAATQDWNAQAAGTGVYALALSADNSTLYIGGVFALMGGQTRKNLAALTTGVSPGGNARAWNPTAGGQVADIFVSSTRVYVGGNFTQMGTQSNRNNFAEFNKCTTAVLGEAPANVCEGEGITISASPSGGQTPYKYSWAPAVGLNSITAQNPTATGLTAGDQTHSVVVTDANGCTASAFVTFNVWGKPTLSVLPATVTICKGSVNGAQLSGTQNLSQYAWSPATGLSDATIYNPVAKPDVTTSYILTVTDANGCTNKDTSVVTVIDLKVDAGNDQSVCSGVNAELEAVVTGAGAGTPTFSWTPTINLNNASIPDPVSTTTITRTYTVTVTDANGCTAIDSIMITVNALPNLNAGVDTFTCVDNAVILQASNVTGGQYEWTPAGYFIDAEVRNPVALFDTPGTYKAYVMVTDANGCQAKDSLLITANPLPSISLDVSEPVVCAGTTITLTAVHNGNIFNWDNDPSIVDPTQLVTDATPTVTTDYVFNSTGVNGCTNLAVITVTVNALPIIIAGEPGPDTTAFCAGTNGILLIANGPSNTVYQWTPANGLENPNNDITMANPAAMTTYTVTGTDGNGCVNKDSITVNVNTVPVASVSFGGPGSICSGESQTLIATGSTKYLWYVAAGQTYLDTTGSATVVASPPDTTQYFVIVSDNIGCSDTATITLSVRPLPNAEAGDGVDVCKGLSVQLNATDIPGLTYLWTDTSATQTLSALDIVNPTATPLVTTRYDLQVTDASGCKATDFVLVGVKPVPVANAGTDTTICVGDSILLKGSGVITGSYEWQPQTGMIDGNTATPKVAPAVTTTYTLKVTNVFSCENIDSVKVTVNPLPTVTTTATPPGICLGGSTSLQATGGVQYSWTPSETLSDPNIDIPAATPTDTTDYIVRVTDLNGCKQWDTITVIVFPLPNADAGPNVGICVGSPGKTLNATGGTIYSWNPIAGLSDGAIANPVALPAATTVYTVFVTDANNCQNVDSVKVSINPLPIVVASVDTNVCLGSSRQIEAIGAATYAWTPAGSLSDPSADSPIATPLLTTNYTVVGTDTNGCVAVDSVLVTVLPVPTAVASADVTVCAGTSTPLSLTSDGVLFHWSPNVALSDTSIKNPTATPLTTTNYTVLVLGANGCLNADSVLVTVLPLPNLGVSADVTICPDSSTKLIANGAAGYNWQPPAGLDNPNIAEPIAKPSQTTTYTVTGTGSNGCTIQGEVTVTVNIQATPTITPNVPTTICFGSSVQLTVSNAQPGFLYQWSKNDQPIPNAFSTTFTALESGDYSVTGYFQGCTYFSLKTAVTVQPLPLADAGADVSVCKGGAGVNLAATGGTIYSWTPATGLSNPNSGTPNANPTQTTLYSLTVTDGNGCVDTDELLVTVVTPPVVTASPTGPTSFCPGGNVTLKTTEGPGFIYQWKNGAIEIQGATGPAVTVTESGNYLVEISIAGCGKIPSNVIQVTAFLAPTALASSDVTICKGYPAPLSATGGVSYLWSPAAGLTDAFDDNPLASPDVTTTYTVTATDANGCKDSDLVTVNVRQTSGLPIPAVNPTGPRGLCPGSSILLSASQDDFYFYQWKRNGVSIEGAFQPTYTASEAGFYSIEISNPFCGKAVSQTVSVFMFELPRVDLTLKQPTCNDCANGRAVITPTGGATPYKYALNNGAFFTAEVIENMAPGDYILTIEDKNGCRSFISFEMHGPIGVEETLNGLFSLYPNPTDGLVSLKAQNLSGERYTVKVTDMLGKTLNEQMLLTSESGFDTSINLSDYPKGVYLLQISDGVRRLTRKVVLR